MKFSNRRPLCSDFIQIQFTLFAQRCVLAQQFQISIIESLRQTFCPKLVQLSQFDNVIMLEKHARCIVFAQSNLFYNSLIVILR
ncbi:hypothetical protein T07_1376 [Trichinella nelsoni]|uniref:Uncharacterized protein n=1 Tax=Trichinella nelsoni TaxID=6336 RepID=A0A0V0SC82_9BILA|nr:hypothetical protein T07_1376 [Trichinella nelsoni]